MVSYFNELRREGISAELAVIKGAVLRLRPVLITASVAALGLVPMLSTKFSSGSRSRTHRFIYPNRQQRRSCNQRKMSGA